MVYKVKKKRRHRDCTINPRHQLGKKIQHKKTLTNHNTNEEQGELDDKDRTNRKHEDQSQHQRSNGCRNIFMTNHKRNVPKQRSVTSPPHAMSSDH